MRGTATYRDIQDWVKREFGFVPETCWIAHCKEIYGLPLRHAPNRQGSKRVKPCPSEKQPAIRKALEHFGVL